MTDETSDTPAAAELEGTDRAAQLGPHDQVAQAARRVSETFLGANPGRYFRTRAIRWAQTADQPADPDAPTWPTTAAGDQVRERLGGHDYVGDRRADVQAATTLDAFMLSHHAGESLMRHFLALLSATTNPVPVPWLEMVSLQEGREFRRRLRALLDASDTSLDEAIETLFVPPELAAVIRQEADPSSSQTHAAGGDATDITEDGGEAVAATIRFCRVWLRHFARKFLEAGNGYNAAKHGLSTVTGYSQLAFHPDPDAWEGPGPVPEGQVILEGPEIRTIEHDGARGDQRRWFSVTRHVDPPGLIAHTLIAADLLDWLWEIERARKLRTPAAVPILSGPLPKDVIHGHYRSWGHLRLPLGVLPLEGPVRDATLRRLGLLDEPASDPE